MLAAPLLALGAGFGWYQLLSSAGPYCMYGVGLCYLGMVFVIINDALELAMVVRLPSAFAAALAAERTALLAFGATMAFGIEIFSLIGGLVSSLGILFVAIAMLAVPSVPTWLASLGLAAAVLLLSSTAAVAAPRFRFMSRLRMLGFNLMLLWIVATGVVMWRS